MPDSDFNGRDFPQLDLPTAVEAPVYQARHRFDLPDGLNELQNHMESVGNTLGQMADQAAKTQGREQAVSDVAGAGDGSDPNAPQVTPQNPNTAFGQSYNDVAKQALGEQRKAAMVQAMGQAYANNPENPAGLDAALTAAKQGFSATPFADLNLNLDNEYDIRRATMMTQAQEGLHKVMLSTQAANYQQAYTTGAEGLDQASAGATFDAAGAAHISAGAQQFAQSLAQYGPPEAFTLGGAQIPADPSRAGVITPEQLEAHYLAAIGEAKRTWAINAQMGLPDAAAKAKFADDARAKYLAGDPVFAGLGGAQVEGLFDKLDANAQRASTDEKADQAASAKTAEDGLQALQWGGQYDPDAIRKAAQDSGDPGLVAKTEFYLNAAPTMRGILKTVVGRQYGLIATPGSGLTPQPLDAAGNPIAAQVQAPPPGQNAVADQVRQAAQSAGATPAETTTLLQMGILESRLDPTRNNGQSQGLFQFRPATWAGVGGGDITSVHDQTVNALKLLRQDTAGLTAALGRAPTPGEVYLAHQQGLPGAKALLAAGPGVTAVQALVNAGVYHDPAIAAEAITRNGGTAAQGAGQFAAQWTGRLDGGGGAPGSPAAAPPTPGVTSTAWTPPAGVAPGSPAYVAWANTKAGFAADPIKFAQENQVASVPPMIPQNAVAQDPAAAAGWAGAMKGRYAIGQTLQRSYGVPMRMLTDAEKDDYKSILQQDPAAVVPLAQRATAAIGAAGATAFLREVGQDGDVNTAIHIGNLAVLGNTTIANAAAGGIALKAAPNGAKEVPDPDHSYRTNQDMALRRLAPAFLYDPAVLVAARNTADLARLYDTSRGITHDPDYYLQSALGAAPAPGGGLWGGVAVVNGAQTLVPSWLRQDQVQPALQKIGESWAQRPGTGPVYANGQPVGGQDIGRMQLIERPGGQYFLLNPRSGRMARTSDGQLLHLDLDANRGFIQAQLPGSVRR